MEPLRPRLVSFELTSLLTRKGSNRRRNNKPLPPAKSPKAATTPDTPPPPYYVLPATFGVLPPPLVLTIAACSSPCSVLRQYTPLCRHYRDVLAPTVRDRLHKATELLPVLEKDVRLSLSALERHVCHDFSPLRRPVTLAGGTRLAGIDVDIATRLGKLPVHWHKSGRTIKGFRHFFLTWERCLRERGGAVRRFLDAAVDRLHLFAPEVHAHLHCLLRCDKAIRAYEHHEREHRQWFLKLYMDDARDEADRQRRANAELDAHEARMAMIGAFVSMGGRGNTRLP